MESAVEQEYPHDDFPYQKITLLEYNQKAKGGKQQMAENNNNFKSTVEALFQGMDGVISSKTVVGDAIHVGDTIILPLVDVSFGIGHRQPAAGALHRPAGVAGGGGCGRCGRHRRRGPSDEKVQGQAAHGAAGPYHREPCPRRKSEKGRPCLPAGAGRIGRVQPARPLCGAHRDLQQNGEGAADLRILKKLCGNAQNLLQSAHFSAILF